MDGFRVYFGSSHTSVLISFRTRQPRYLSRFDEKKDVSALGAGSGLVALARTRKSPDAAPREKTLGHALPPQYSLVLTLVTSSGTH